MSNITVIQNAFPPSTLKTLSNLLQDVSFGQPRQKIIKQIQQLSPPEYLWAVCNKPAYFVQYQVQSAAILKVGELVLIVWKPKYIEYPQLIAFPSLLDKKLKNLKVTVDAQTKLTDSNTTKYVQFLQSYYGTYFHNDPDFQTNLITYSKHFVSKISLHQYWHALIDDSDQIYVTNWSKMDNIVKIRVTGVKDGYDKTILMFSFKGKREGLFVTVKNKWMQLIAFLAMVLIFYSVVACPGSGQQEGICVYKQQLTLSGTLAMLALIGLRYRQKSGRKRGGKEKAQ